MPDEEPRHFLDRTEAEFVALVNVRAVVNQEPAALASMANSRIGVGR